MKSDLDNAILFLMVMVLLACAAMGIEHCSHMHKLKAQYDLIKKERS